MKNSLSSALSFFVLVSALVLAACGRSDQATSDANPNSAQTNVLIASSLDTNGPATNAPTDTANSSMTPNAPASGLSSGVPDPSLSSKTDKTVGLPPSSVTTPGSESARTDTNAAPSSNSGGAPSQNSK